MDGRFGALGLLHQPDDLGQYRLRAYGRRLDLEQSLLVHRGPDDFIPNLFVYR